MDNDLRISESFVTTAGTNPIIQHLKLRAFLVWSGSHNPPGVTFNLLKISTQKFATQSDDARFAAKPQPREKVKTAEKLSRQGESVDNPTRNMVNSFNLLKI